MTSTTYTPHGFRTGRPLGLLDLVDRIGRKLFGRRQSTRSQVHSDAAALRRFADDQRKWSPSFAADLYAAADRHELINDAR